MVITEAMLAELHPELAEKLKTAHGKPLMISITYKDEANNLQYWLAFNNDFPHDDMEIAMDHLTKQVEDNHKPRNAIVIQDFKKQLQMRKRAKLRR